MLRPKLPDGKGSAGLTEKGGNFHAAGHVGSGGLARSCTWRLGPIPVLAQARFLFESMPKPVLQVVVSD